MNPVNVTKFLSSIDQVLAANPNAWSSVTLDFENYDHTLNPENYTSLVVTVQAYLKAKFPNISLRMCISPDRKNRDYYDINALAKAGVVFQVMFYDYAMGQDPRNMRV